MWLVSPGGFYTFDARSRHRIGRCPGTLEGTRALLAFPLYCQSQGLKELVLVIQDVIPESFTSLSKAASVYVSSLRRREFWDRRCQPGPGLQLLRASFHTWRKRRLTVTRYVGTCNSLLLWPSAQGPPRHIRRNTGTCCTLAHAHAHTSPSPPGQGQLA